MNFFRRSQSMESSRSCSTSGAHSIASSAGTPRTSMDSISASEYEDMVNTIKAPCVEQTAPLLRLPIELLQQVASNLDTPSAATFSLSSRTICFALGTQYLVRHLNSARNRFEKRRAIEQVVERAFPGHWFCAWCDTFHPWAPSEGPLDQGAWRARDCTAYNSYLSDSDSDYVLAYHHVRLALHRHLYGPAHGIPLSAFIQTQSSTVTIFRTPVPTKLHIEARIYTPSPEEPAPHFLLHASLSLILPSWTTRHKALLSHLYPLLPPLISAHRATPHGHTGLMATLDNVVRRGFADPGTQSCTLCRTDWSVSTLEFRHASGGQVRVEVRCWRDLGIGEGPFGGGWRAHGVAREGVRGCGAASDVRGAVEGGLGDVRRMWESAGCGRVKMEEVGDARTDANASAGFGAWKGRGDGRGVEGNLEIKRSRSRIRPVWWRTRSENEEVMRRDEEERASRMREMVEERVRWDEMGRGW